MVTETGANSAAEVSASSSSPKGEMATTVASARSTLMPASCIDSFSQHIMKLQDSEALRTVYTEQMEWARHFNGLIWTIGSILLPFSFAGFALSFRNEAGILDVYSLLFTGIGSVSLLCFWALLGDWHRKLWGRAFTLCGAIEARWGLRAGPAAEADFSKHLLHDLTPVDRGSRLRWMLVAVCSIAWVTRCLVAVLGRN